MTEVLKIRVTGSQGLVNQFTKHVGDRDKAGKLEIRSIGSYHTFYPDYGTRSIEVGLETLNDLLIVGEQYLSEGEVNEKNL